MTIFDVADVVDTAPGQLGPANFKELVPGVWIPNPAVNELKPGLINDNNVRMPLYASDIQVTKPGDFGPYGMMELGDNANPASFLRRRANGPGPSVDIYE